MASEFDKALTDFERAVELQPRGYTVYVHLGEERDRLEHKIQTTRRSTPAHLCAMSVHRPFHVLFTGLLHFQMENQAKAMKAFKNALNRFPTVGRVWKKAGGRPILS